MKKQRTRDTRSSWSVTDESKMLLTLRWGWAVPLLCLSLEDRPTSQAGSRSSSPWPLFPNLLSSQPSWPRHSLPPLPMGLVWPLHLWSSHQKWTTTTSRQKQLVNQLISCFTGGNVRRVVPARAGLLVGVPLLLSPLHLFILHLFSLSFYSFSAIFSSILFPRFPPFSLSLPPLTDRLIKENVNLACDKFVE